MSRNAWGVSFFVRRGVSEGVSLKSERGVERGFSSEELGGSLFCFVPSVAPPSAPLEQGVIPSLGTSLSNVGGKRKVQAWKREERWLSRYNIAG